MSLEPRVVDLELRYMKLEKLLHDLSDVLVEQERTIARLVAEVAALRERLPEEQSNEPPPHY